MIKEIIKIRRRYSDVTGGLDFCNFARRTDMDEAPTPEPAV